MWCMLYFTLMYALSWISVYWFGIPCKILTPTELTLFKKKFLNHPAVRIDGEYKLFLARFNFECLHFKRYFHSLKFLHALMSNDIHCPKFLNPINSVTVIGLKSPITFMLRNYNSVNNFLMSLIFS